MTGLATPEAFGFFMLGALLLYAVTGGADFGGGVWDLLASGPRADAQRAAIERAIAPVWEANHVWLILVVVLLFSAFPPAYAAISIALHVPVVVMLLGIVLRGSAFVFRQYGGGAGWGRVFAVASVLTPLCLGVIVAALVRGIRFDARGVPEGGFFLPWLGIFPFAVGALTLAAFAFLAAVYLAAEAHDRALADDFRARALGASGVVAVAAASAAMLARHDAAAFHASLIGRPWSFALLAGGAVAAAACAAALTMRAFRVARALAVIEVAIVIGGWGLAQAPFIVRPDVTLRGAAAPDVTLRLMVPVLGTGLLLLVPSLYWLLRIFKSAVR